MLDLTFKMSNVARKQLGIQTEVVMNNDKHAVLPIHDLYVCQQVMQALVPSSYWQFVS